MAEEKAPGEKHEPTADEKMDAWTKRMDAMCDRMDAFMEEHGPKKDAKKDAEEEMADRKDAKEEGEGEEDPGDEEAKAKRKDAKKDEGEEEPEEEKEPKKDAAFKGAAPPFKKDSKKDEGEEGGEPEPMASDDKRKDRRDAKRDSEKEEERADARADSSAMRRRIDDLERMVRRNQRVQADEELDAISEAQREWGVIAMAHGERASRPLDGEPIDVYNRRHAKRFQKHSDTWGKVDLSTLPRDVLAIAIPEIRKDSMAAAHRGDPSANAVLREVQHTDRTGRIISEFVGPVSATLAPFRLPVMRVKRINNQPSQF